MPRVKGGSASDKKRKKLFKITKGFWGRKKNTYKRAKEASLHALASAYKDRRARKRDFRRLWVTRISAAARMNDISYSNFINGLKRAGIQVNRKMLADLAVNDMQAFKVMVEKAKEALEQ
ncbi:50S ribosomal protein L20 [Thermovirga sp.]|uniref:50S ribosomal protein L20 n=1 Tax=Thermovirga sp. TaxID=2699834 RepID=UPI0025D894B6|nr:50S ribosomal protein L20 [Thermovirga sp.]MBO8153573.1 50S ribosomal protein L20 [Thermovirga sp.]